MFTEWSLEITKTNEDSGKWATSLLCFHFLDSCSLLCWIIFGLSSGRLLLLCLGSLSLLLGLMFFCSSSLGLLSFGDLSLFRCGRHLSFGSLCNSSRLQYDDAIWDNLLRILDSMDVWVIWVRLRRSYLSRIKLILNILSKASGECEVLTLLGRTRHSIRVPCWDAKYGNSLK